MFVFASLANRVFPVGGAHAGRRSFGFNCVLFFVNSISKPRFNFVSKVSFVHSLSLGGLLPLEATGALHRGHSPSMHAAS